VNFIMNDRFQGVQGEINYGFYNHSQQGGQGISDIVAARAVTNPAQFAVPGDKSRDGEESDYNLTMGSNFANNKGNATFFVGYKKTKALLQSERDYSACAAGSTAAGFTCGGSSTASPARVLDLTSGRSYVATATGTRPYVGANDQYNYGPLNYYQRPSERYTGAAYVNYEINSHAKVYGELNIHDDHTTGQIAPSGIFFGNLTVPVAFENPLLSQAWRTSLGLTGPGTSNEVWIGKRNVEGGGRQADLRHTSYRGVIGVKGEINPAWNYDAFFQTGQVVYQQTYRNEFSQQRTLRALDVVRNPANGQPICRSALDGTDPNCVPYNVWTLGGITSEALGYIQTPGLQNGNTFQSVFGGTVNGDLGAYGWQLPTAKSPVGVAFGIEQRTEKLTLETDNSFSTGDLAGQGGATIGLEGKYTVRDLYMEARVPLVEGKEFAERLSLSGSYRYSDYSTDQSTDSYGLGLEWAITKKIMARGSYQQAVRAANIVELFTAQGLALYDNDEDPCAGAIPTRSLADCARTGVTSAQYGRILDNPAGQYNYLQGGNPNLKPETSKSSTLGLVWTPTKDFNATLDWFNIKVDDVISIAPPTITLQQCLDTGNPTYCSQITRDSQGTLWANPAARIIGTNVNLSKWETSGVDFSMNYNYKLNQYGGLALTFIGTYLKSFEQEPIPGLGKYDCAGLYGGTCGTPLPEWRHKARLNWMTPWNFDVAMTWRYIDAVLLDRTSANPLLAGTVNSVDKELKAQNYLDLAASWIINKQLTLSGGINNITDREPPVSAQVGAGFGNGNTYPQVYDALGRRVFMTLTAKF
jgi:outer membrane receptor protein involved in Fe transport